MCVNIIHTQKHNPEKQEFKDYSLKSASFYTDLGQEKKTFRTISYDYRKEN